MTKTSAAYKRHLREIESGIYSHGMVRGLCKAGATLDRIQSRLSVGPTATKMTFNEFDKLVSLLGVRKPLAEKARQDMAVKLLLNLQFTPKGAQRKNAPLKPFQRAALMALQDIRIVGLVEVARGWNGALWYPVFQVTGINGDMFNYYHVSWQSGGKGPEILAQGESW